jgi:hypothetical protein
MSIETEIKAVEQDVTKDVAAVVTDVKHDGDFVTSVVTQEAEKVEAGIEAELDKVAPEVKAEVQKAEAAVTKIEKRARIAIAVTDKLAIREIENVYLRAAQDLATAQQKMQNAQNNYRATVESFVSKYGINPVEHAWDELSASFKSVEVDLAAKLRSL